MRTLPHEFLKRMEDFLGNEFTAFVGCYEKPYYKGLRLNLLKCDKNTLFDTLPYSLKPAPFSSLSYYLPYNAEKVGSLPMHHAGAFYLQEPSAASAVTVLDPKPGDNVLDLCAAPGGKTTQIASLLNGKGLLWSNEFVKSRANILLSNIERMGVKNAVISSCHPETLCSRLASFFDKVLVDAPCSGEGMFRKDPQAVAEWSAEHVKACAVRQLAILESASQTVRLQGTLVYSTCTFSEEENEGVVSEFLSRHPDFELQDSGVSFGRPAQLPKARRIFPMDQGEGHFVAKLCRVSGETFQQGAYAYPKKDSSLDDFYRQIYKEPTENCLARIGKNIYLLPKNLPDLKNLGVIRAGLFIGEAKENRMEPAHAAFMAARPQELCRVIDLDKDKITAYLHGDEIDAPPDCKGYYGVTVNGVITGFGKCSGGRLKNHYPKGLRNH